MTAAALIRPICSSDLRGRGAPGELLDSGAFTVLGPFQDATARAVGLLCCATEEKRTGIPFIKTEGKQTA